MTSTSISSVLRSAHPAWLGGTTLLTTPAATTTSPVACGYCSYNAVSVLRKDVNVLFSASGSATATASSGACRNGDAQQAGRIRKRYFSATVTDVEESSTGTGRRRPLESWEEVEQHHLKIPTLENYKRPKNAPLPTELTRADYHQFMRGKPRRWQQQTVCPAVGAALICFVCCEMAYAMFKLKPDDFDWIEEERARAKAARDRIDAELRRKEKEAALNKQEHVINLNASSTAAGGGQQEPQLGTASDVATTQASVGGVRSSAFKSIL